MSLVKEQSKSCVCCSSNPDQPNQSCLKGCKNSCSNHYPRCGPFYTCLAFDACCLACDKPGIGSKDFQGGNLGDCPLICIPCTIVADIFCCIPIIFGCWGAKCE